jgi:hypothetical protein
MTYIDFGVTSLKFKVTGVLNFGMVSAQYLENYLSESLNISHIDGSKLEDGPFYTPV